MRSLEDVHDELLTVLARAQDLGFLGPKDIGGQLAHSVAFAELVERLLPTYERERLRLLDLGSGRTSQFTVSTQSTTHQRVHLFGTKGRIEITIPFNQPQTEPITYLTHDGMTSLDGLDATRHVVRANDQYALIAEWFSDMVRTEEPSTTGLDDALVNARILDALFRSEKTSTFEAV